MKKHTLSLGDYIRQTMLEKSLSFRQVEENSRKKISGAYVNDLMQGKSSDPSVKKLQALARGLGVPEEELFRVARGLPLDPKADYNTLPQRVAAVVERLSAGDQLHIYRVARLVEATAGDLTEEEEEKIFDQIAKETD